MEVYSEGLVSGVFSAPFSVNLYSVFSVSVVTVPPVFYGAASFIVPAVTSPFSSK